MGRDGVSTRNFPVVLLFLAVFAACSDEVREDRLPEPTVLPIPIIDVSHSRSNASGDPGIGETHSVFDLIDNRHLAHRTIESGLWIDAGSPGFGRYIHGNRPWAWSLNESVDERPVAVARRRDPTLYFPLDSAQAEQLAVIQLWVWYESGRGVISANLDGERLSDAVPTAGWQEITFEVPSGFVSAGEHTLVLRLPADATRRGGEPRFALQGVYFGAEPLSETIEPLGESLVLFGGEGVAFYSVLPEQASLRVALGGPVDTPCSIEARVRLASGGEYSFGARLDRRGEAGVVELPLAYAPAGEVVRLDLNLDASCSETILRHVSIRIPGPPPRIPEFEPPTNVVIWLIDTLRADRLRSINPDTRVQSPRFDRFAAEGAVFTQTYVQGNESFASHAALFSGRYPEATGVRSSRDHLGNDSELLAELARRAGLFTGGYSSNGHIRSANGFEQGFQTYVNALRDNYRYLAPGLVGHARRWIDEHGGVPFFLYVGTVDCHVTYRSHEDILPLYDPDPYDGLFQRTVGGDELGQIKSGAIRLTDRDRVRIEAIYDDTVTFSDRHFGLFLDDLESRGILDETLIVITSDHGDEFWEHDSVGHGHSLYDELVHVPLLFRYPPAIPGGTVIDNGAETIDLLPTLAELLGIEASESTQGESLLGLMHGIDGAYPRPSITQMYGHTHAMRLHDWKVIWRRDGERRLYNLIEDPTEQQDVGEANPYALRFLSDAMGLYMSYREEWSKRQWGVASNLRPSFSP
jgi:arylsulfatase A-like enzyme